MEHSEEGLACLAENDKSEVDHEPTAQSFLNALLQKLDFINLTGTRLSILSIWQQRLFKA